MQRKLQCIVVDDDTYIHDIFKDYLKDNEYAEVTDYYEDPTEFINANKKPDLVFLDIMMPKIDGLSLASMIKPTPVILFTSNRERFGDIMNMMEAIDAFPKPIIKERLLLSVKDAYVLLNSDKFKRAHKLFRTDKGDVTVLLSDILFVRTVKNSHRKLEMYLKKGKKHILLRYSLEDVQEIVGFLQQSNRFELVAPTAVEIIEPNYSLKIKGILDNGKPVHSELHENYRKNFLAHLPSK
jgi:DNA-binding LytR/AlgR family response regulator